MMWLSQGEVLCLAILMQYESFSSHKGELRFDRELTSMYVPINIS